MSSCSNGLFGKSNGDISKKEENAFIEEIGGCSETYKGSLSESVYDDAEDAAEAYVLEEIAEQNSDYTINSVVCDGTLTDQEVNALGITDEMMEGATSVKKYTVEYAVSDGDGLMRLAGNNDKSQVIVYVIGGDNWFRYFSPVVTTGDTVTKGYYDSIFNNEKFDNCTVVSTSTMTIKAGVLVFSKTQEMTMTSTVKYANNCVYIEQRIDSEVEGVESSNEKIYVELSETGVVLKCYTYENGTWMSAYLTDDSITKPFGNQFLHYSYFTKTDYGCTLEKDNLNAYMKKGVNLSLDSNVGDSMECEGSVNYYVSDGVLTGVLSKIIVNMDYNGASITETIQSTTKCIDYGTTTIENPLI